MAYIFVDDGAPEAREYDSNYIFFDDRVPGERQRAMQEAQQRQSQALSLRNRKPCDDSGLTESARGADIRGW